MIVFATVGTDKHPFDRLIEWIDQVAASRPDIQCVVQYGTSSPPSYAAGIDYLNHDQLLSWVDRATVVITAGGPATIAQVRERHGRPIVVPRHPDLGEHVDRHQLEFSAMLSRIGAISLATSPAELDEHINEHLNMVQVPLSSLSVSPVGIAGFAREVNAMLGSSDPIEQ